MPEKQKQMLTITRSRPCLGGEGKNKRPESIEINKTGTIFHPRTGERKKEKKKKRERRKKSCYRKVPVPAFSPGGGKGEKKKKEKEGGGTVRKNSFWEGRKKKKKGASPRPGGFSPTLNDERWNGERRGEKKKGQDKTVHSPPPKAPAPPLNPSHPDPPPPPPPKNITLHFSDGGGKFTTRKRGNPYPSPVPDPAKEKNPPRGSTKGVWMGGDDETILISHMDSP